ncbi:MAG: long-chain fatty acid--CoA ligase [Nocardioides sp.]|nr:long-chain fatty acid--CoA ligase [Nocardioides sp.]
MTATADSHATTSSNDADLEAVRAEIEGQVAGRTITRLFLDTVAEHGDHPAYSDKIGVTSEDGKGWRTLSWNEVAEAARHVGAALVEAGVQPGDHVAVMASNRIEHVLADIGSLHAGAVPMSIYNTLSPEQVAYVASHSEPTAVILEGTDQVARWAKALAEVASIRTVVVMEAGQAPADSRARSWSDLVTAGAAYDAEHPEAVDERVAATDLDSPATILYTSGTTGNPKGVVLTHHNVAFEVVGSMSKAQFEEENVFISYLPFAHIAERAFGMYIPWTEGGHIHLIGDPTMLLGALGEVHPTRFFGVPRVWEKIKTGVSAKLAAEQDPNAKAFVEQCMATGLEWVESQQLGGTTSPELQQRYEEADAGMLSILRALLGLDRLEWAGSAAAPMPLEVAKFFAGLGIRIYDIYGMTETCGAVTSGGPDDFRLGTVGRALPGIEVRIAEDGEILARGPVTTHGYFKAEEATAALKDADGWVHTGDIGEMDDDGFVKVVDRKKELIITSSGKNIAPSNIENYLKESPIIGHAMAVGDSKPYVVAVMTLDGEIAPLVAQRLGVEFTDLADLATKPQIRAMAQQAVDAANERLSRPEQVKAFELLGTEWTAESEELTPTLKLKRRVVNAKYSDVLDRLYG